MLHLFVLNLLGTMFANKKMNFGVNFDRLCLKPIKIKNIIVKNTLKNITPIN